MNSSLQPSPVKSVLRGWLPFVGSAALIAYALHLSFENPWLGAALAVGAMAFLVPQIAARRRMRQLLRSGNVDRVLEVWDTWVDHVAEPHTMGPLIRATALAAYGLTDRSRRLLAQAERGRAWELAVEHRLFVETLLDAFDGNREAALGHAGALSSLPLPASPWARSRALVLRAAAGALARAFAHCAVAGDERRLLAAADQNPLVYWAMRYALAIVRIDRGERDRAQMLLDTAPSWPESSVFSAFQEELSSRAREPA